MITEGDPVKLTRREKEVLTLSGHGLPAKVVALELGISQRTVEAHLQTAYTKLGAQCKIDAVRLAIANRQIRNSFQVVR